MPDRAFEIDVERRFADPPPAFDPDGFADRVTARLDRNWRFRQILIGGLGVVGGLIGATQFVGGGLVAQLADGWQRTSGAIAQVSAARGAFDALLTAASDAVTSGASLDSRIVIMSAALAVIAGGLFLTRAIREI